MSYYEKYLKYKRKYLLQTGGGSILTDILAKIRTITTDAISIEVKEIQGQTRLGKGLEITFTSPIGLKKIQDLVKFSKISGPNKLEIPQGAAEFVTNNTDRSKGLSLGLDYNQVIALPVGFKVAYDNGKYITSSQTTKYFPWDPKAFSRGWKTAGTDRNKKKEQLKTVAISNETVIQKFFDPKLMVTTKYTYGSPLLSSGKFSKLNLEKYLDTTDGAIVTCWNQGFKHIIALNFANASHLGGGYLNGAIAQEEELCRQYPCLYSSLTYKQLYPLAQKDVLYTVNIPRQRESLSWNYEYITNPNIIVDFISAAAPDTNKVGKYDFDYYKSDIEKCLDMIFQVPATVKDYDVLIIGAWGCGAFAPRDATMSLKYRNEMIKTIVAKIKKYGSYYKSIIIAVPDNDNMDIFKKYI